MQYQWILFDADETLFHFDAFAGLQRMFRTFEVEFSQHDFTTYQAVNQPLWVAYQEGNITALALQQRRFQSWADKLNLTTMQLNNAFLDAMAEICTPLPGAVSLLTTLKGKVKMGIITNGFAALQERRLAHTGLKDLFEFVIISELVGVAKPDRAIFDAAFSCMSLSDKDQVLMVGDNLHSDILGGNNAGVDTCWLNASNKPSSDAIKPNYVVKDLAELQRLLVM